MRYRSTTHNPPPEPERAAMTDEFQKPPEFPREAWEELKRQMAQAEAISGGDEPFVWGQRQGETTEDGQVIWTTPGDRLGSRATRPMYYYPDGKPILDDELLPAALKWAMLLGEKRHVANTRTLYGERLSTVWLGLDHQFGISPTAPPIIFETMLFAPDPDRIRRRSLSGLFRAMKGEPADTSESEAFEAHIKKHFPHDQLQLRYSTKTEAEESHEKLKLQCLIPPRWRHFLLWTIGRDRTWAHYGDEDYEW